MWRWLKRLVITVIVLVALAAGAVQVVLWTDLPRRLVADALRQQTGLRVEVDALRTSWGGVTRVDGLLLALPGEIEPLATIDNARLEHTNLVMLALTGAFKLEEVQAHDVDLHVRQDEMGYWNVSRALELMSGGGGDAAGGGGGAQDIVAALETVKLRDLTVDVTANDGRRVVLEPIDVDAAAIGSATVRLVGSVGDQAKLEGQVALRGQWPHRFVVDVQSLQALGGDWLAELPEPAKGKVKWDGRLTNGELRGQLAVQSLALGEYGARGDVRLATDFAGATVQPQKLVVFTGDDAGMQATLTGGVIRVDEGGLALERLDVNAAGADARISGRYDPAEDAATLEAKWRGVVPGQRLVHEGDAQVNVVQALGRPRIELAATTHGHTPDFGWLVAMQFAATGDNWRKLTWRLTAPTADLTLGEQRADQRRVPLAGLAASGRMDWPRVDMDEVLHDQVGAVRGTGWFDAHSMQWAANISGTARDVTGFLEQDVEVALEMRGSPQRIDVQSAMASSDQFHVEATGRYVLAEQPDPPLLLDVKAAWSSQALSNGRGAETDEADETMTAAPADDSEQTVAASPRDDDAVAINGIDAASPPQPEAAADLDGPSPPNTLTSPATASASPDWGADAQFTGTIVGHVLPVDLRIAGKLLADRLRTSGQDVPPLSVWIEGAVDDRRITATTRPFDLFGGRAELDVAYLPSQQLVTVDTNLQRISMAKLAAAFDPALVIAGEADADVTLKFPAWELRRAQASGPFRIDAFRYGDVRFDSMAGRLRPRRPGLFEINRIIARQGDGRMTGQALFDIRVGALAGGDFTLHNWPLDVPLSDAMARIDGDLNVQTDLTLGSFVGDFDVAADLLLEKQPVGTLNLVGDYDGKRVQFTLDQSPLLGGTASGRATLPMDDWKQSRGEIVWQDIDPSVLETWLPAATDLAGSADGRITFAPATDPQAPEPLRIDLAIQPRRTLQYREVSWGPVSAQIHAGEDRILMDELVMSLTGGEVRLWLSLHQQNDTWFDHVLLTFSNLDLNELRRVAPDQRDTEPMPGRLSGRINAYGRPDDIATHVGSGQVRLADSSLQNTDIIGGVFAAMGIRPSEPTGRGFVDFRLEDGALYISRFSYRNGSTEILVTGHVDSLAMGMDSPIHGQALGSVRPLQSLDMTVFDELDRLMRALQSNLTMVRIEGTLNDPDVAPAGLSEAGDMLDRLFEGKR